jgi:putative ABC transport system substrate-binding protein
MIRRRDVITLLGGAAAWPLAARAQQDRVRQIGVLRRGLETNRSVQAEQGALRESLARLGWIEGRNVRFDVRFSDSLDGLRAYADELVRLGPEIIVVGSQPATQAVLQRTQTIPTVFFNVGDPVAGGLLKNIARPEGNATGTTSMFQSLPGKWLELLMEAAPRTARVALIFVPGIVTENYFAAIGKTGQALGVKAIETPYRNAAELERALDSFAAEPNGGLLLVPPPPRGDNRELIGRLALKYRLPTISANKDDLGEGLMVSYGGDGVETVKIAASYVDRILRGTKVSELPVEYPTKFELVINLKTAKALGLTIPPALLALADEVIE